MPVLSTVRRGMQFIKSIDRENRNKKLLRGKSMRKVRNQNVNSDKSSHELQKTIIKMLEAKLVLPQSTK